MSISLSVLKIIIGICISFSSRKKNLIPLFFLLKACKCAQISSERTSFQTCKPVITFWHDLLQWSTLFRYKQTEWASRAKVEEFNWIHTTTQLTVFPLESLTPEVMAAIVVADLVCKFNLFAILLLLLQLLPVQWSVPVQSCETNVETRSAFKTGRCLFHLVHFHGGSLVKQNGTKLNETTYKHAGISYKLN